MRGCQSGRLASDGCGIGKEEEAGTRDEAGNRMRRQAGAVCAPMRGEDAPATLTASAGERRIKQRSC